MSWLSRTPALVALALLAPAAPVAAQEAWSADTIHEARLFFQANAALGRRKKDCITTMNHAIKEIFYAGRRVPQLGSRIDLTFGALIRARRATRPTVIECVDARGRLTTGAERPVRASESVFAAAVALTGGVPGWHVLGLSIMDGYHAVTLVVDTRNPDRPYINFADQHNGGWQVYGDGPLAQASRGAFDQRLADDTQEYYRRFLRDNPRVGPPRTRIQLWRLLPPQESNFTGDVDLEELESEPDFPNGPPVIDDRPTTKPSAKGMTDRMG